MPSLQTRRCSNLAHVSVQSDKFTETAGSSAWMGNKDNHHVTFSTVGLRTEIAVDVFDSRVGSRGSLAWRRGWGDLASTKNLAFNDKSTDFSTSSAFLSRKMAFWRQAVSTSRSVKNTRYRWAILVNFLQK